jgi:hypothetical protein
MYKEALREYKRQPQEQAPKGKFSFFIKDCLKICMMEI